MGALKKSGGLMGVVVVVVVGRLVFHLELVVILSLVF